MVCSLKSGRMAALARLLADGSVSQTVAEDIDRQKLTAKYLHRELREADEANLIDEEDMHVFGLRPMADPLYLVCCNACKKPIKSSHYAAHSELCKSLNFKEEIVSEVDGASGQKKLPRKDRKKLLVAQANQATTVREQEKFESLDSDIMTAPESHFDEELQMISLAEAKRNTKCGNETPRINSLKVNPVNMERSETVIPSPTKRVKRTVVESQSCPDAKSPCITSEEVLQCRDIPTRSSGRSEKISKVAIRNQTSDEIYESLVTKDVPAPIATKMYYSQRNHYLRSIISHMFYAESRKEQSSEYFTSEGLQVNSEQTQPSSPSYLYRGKVKNQQREEHSLHLGQTLDQIPAGNSELYMGKSQGFVPAANISSPFPVNNTLEPHTSIGNISNYIPNSYSFAGRTGNPIGTMQQANGRVPVV
ncbi:uncharacterized protein LOC111371471 isoform X2 [Olea europaea var. sylvestris]|uniref:uncharacterized protein LOC111371471 isoform X2 n=1 Tax=Olea europaea var. sylvestris TaxID=158386 RepID=UPI000C1D7A2B|nr:uncharacterized protein LOC111371471 isoform X2 [Olea europaea var. sylvestris]